MAWDVVFHPDFDPEFDALAADVQDELLAQAKLIEAFGPTLGRPRVDTLKGSRHANMKELRFTIDDGIWRIAFAFDPKRRAVLPVSADKSGDRRATVLPAADRQGGRALRSAPRSSGGREEDEMSTLTQRMAQLPPARRKKVDDRARALIAEEMSLRDLRRARKQTQVRVAEKLRINQENVSRLEQRSDLLISTLSGYVAAMGGKLSLVVEFPDRPPVTLTGLAALDDPSENDPATP